MSKQGEIPVEYVIDAFETWGIPNPTEVRGVHIGVRWIVVERWASDDEHYEITEEGFDQGDPHV